jgi:hypothetical protein
MAKGLRHGFLSATLVVASLISGVVGGDVLETVGFSSCNTNANVRVDKVNIKYNADNKTVTFDVAGSSNKIQNVTAVLNVTVYGRPVYSNSFDPCDSKNFVEQLCPGMNSSTMLYPSCFH